MESNILANAALVRQVAFDKVDVDAGFDECGVRWLDGYIDRQRDTASEDLKAQLPSTLGSFVGECIRQSYGGVWIQDANSGWGVRLNDRLTVVPFNKVRKQLANADGESVLGLFTAIRPMLDGIPDASIKLDTEPQP